jgi:hypothetical protein
VARLKPEENHCKKCGEPVRYATLITGRTNTGVAFDAKQVVGAGYQLEEQLDDQGVATGRWVATYTKVADRAKGARGFRQHDCIPQPHFDNRDMTPVLIQGVWHLVHRGSIGATRVRRD